MPDDNDFEDEPDEKSPAWYRKEVARINQELAEAKAAAETNAGAARRIAFQDAGIPDSPQANFFREHYSGEMNAEAIKAAAAEHGFIADENPAAAESAAAAEAQAAAAAGGEGILAPDDLSEMEREMDEAASRAGNDGREIADAINEVYRRYQPNVVQ